MQGQCLDDVHSTSCTGGTEQDRPFLDRKQTSVMKVASQHRSPGEYSKGDNGQDENDRMLNSRDATKQHHIPKKASYDTGTSTFKGVNWNQRAQKWQVQITIDGKSKFLGYFDSEVAAARKYDEVAATLVGRLLNFPKTLPALVEEVEGIVFEEASSSQCTSAGGCLGNRIGALEVSLGLPSPPPGSAKAAQLLDRAHAAA